MFLHDDQHREMPISYQLRAVIRNKINFSLITLYVHAEGIKQSIIWVIGTTN